MMSSYFDGIDWNVTRQVGMVVRKVDRIEFSSPLDSTRPSPAVTGKHVHVRPETATPASRAPSDEAAGYGEHPRYHR